MNAINIQIRKGGGGDAYIFKCIEGIKDNSKTYFSSKTYVVTPL